MVQNKQKSNKINIIALITCFMLIMVFVFGSVDYAHASESIGVKDVVSHFSISGDYLGWSGTFSSGYIVTVYSVQNNSEKFVAFNDYNSHGFISNEPFSVIIYEYYKGKYENYKSVSASLRADNLYCFSSSGATIEYDNEICTMLCFRKEADALNYLKTGEINNPIYDNRPIEYDESVELPLLAQCQVNGDLFLFNSKQSVAHSDYTIQLSADCRLTPVYSNFASKSYADTKQSYRTNKNEIGKYDNHGVSFNTSFSTSDLLNGVDTSRKALGFKEFYNGIYINLPYEKCTLSEIVFYARNICGNKCSNWVRVTYDLVNETSKYEEIESVTGSNVPSDTKHNNSEYYPDDYLYNDDEAFNSSSNISNTLTNLKSNYTSLANFYKELFSFLPSEIWILLIGLVGTMVVIAIVIFVRG